MKYLSLFTTCLGLIVFLHGCSEDIPEPVKDSSKLSVVDQESVDINVQSDLEFPDVYVEELDQSQEFYKEQHETSFSFVSKKNWFSYTASKDGILTKILFFGKPNFRPSDHYGDSMHGFIREGNPDTGAKFGEWDLSRDDIVNQLSAQGIKDREAGWITIRMKGKIPQIAGKTYFFVCEKITGGKPWFGAFAFGEGNPYKEGKFWLHPDHDLIFRTYVGKTPEQVTKDQKNKEIIEALGVNENEVPTNPSDLPTPFPISQTTNNVVIQRVPPISEPISTIEPISEPQNTPVVEQTAIPSIQTEQLNIIQIPSVENDEQNKSREKSSLFNRLFKKK
ncbi:MAG: hypothetical protein P8P49_00765 [Opitutales bacterium]|nr:hypothetical protein [Opitutales bacterium]